MPADRAQGTARYARVLNIRPNNLFCCTCLTITLHHVTGQLQSTTEQLEQISTAHEQQTVELENLKLVHSSLQSNSESQTAQLQDIQAQHADLVAAHSSTSQQLAELQSQHSQLQAAKSALDEELSRVQASLSAAEDARIQAEVRSYHQPVVGP